MPRPYDRLLNVRRDLRSVLERREYGTADRPRLVAPVDLTEERIEAWAPDSAPNQTFGERGGSSSPREVEDRAEASRLARQVGRDLPRFPLLLDEIERACAVFEPQTRPIRGRPSVRLYACHRIVHYALDRLRDVNAGAASPDYRAARLLEGLADELYLMVQRYTETVHPSKLPVDLPECRSCARPQEKRDPSSGHRGVPVYEKAKKHLLCRWCYDYALDNARRRGLPKGDLGDLPALDVVDLRHRVGERAAGNELAKRIARAS